MTKGRRNQATAKSDCVMGTLKKSMYAINHRQEMVKTGQNGVIRK